MAPGQFEEICRLTSREDLIGTIAFLMANPLHRLMRTLQAPLSNVGVLLGELKRTKNA
jgi:ribosomal protein L10